MLRFIQVFAALGICLASLLGYAETSGAQQNPVTAIDIALEPDQTMIRHAQADNARLLKVFPKGFALDATHHPHVTMLQQFVRTAGLEKVYAAVNKVLAEEKPTSWKLQEALSQAIDWWGDLPPPMKEAIEQFRVELGTAIDSVEFVKKALSRQVHETDHGRGPP